MTERKKGDMRKGPTTGVIIGVALGILVTLVFKKIGYGILMGIVIAFLLRKAFK